jgi:4-hydroxybenzoate polyprenyltransferase
MNYLKLIRWPNLVIIVLVQYLIRFFIIESLFVPHYLSPLWFGVGVLCSISLAAAGYIINDLYDKPTDAVNKPDRVLIDGNVSENVAWGMYATFNSVAFICGYLLARHIDMPDLWMLPPVAAALLYLYAVDLKKRPVLGNLLVSILTALPVFLVAVYDVLPAANTENAAAIQPFLYAIIAYALFAFYTNFIREIIKDAEDLEGDVTQGFKTLAVIMGRSYIRYVIIILLLVLLIFTGYFNGYLLSTDIYSSVYILLFINLPIAYLIYKIVMSHKKQDFKQASTLMKIIMLTGILSMVVFTLSLNQNI